MLSILNATVSHELRNPLNAIAGQNIQKEGLYDDLGAKVQALKEIDNPLVKSIGRDIFSIMERL